MMPTPTLPDAEYITIHGYRRAVRIAGSGPPLVLLHGIGDNSQTWAPVFAQLTARFTVIAPDMLGHGASDKPRADYSVPAFANGLRDLLTILGYSQVALVGHSLGGGVVMQFTYQYPEMVREVVLVNAGGLGSEVHPVLAAAAIPFVGSAVRLLQIPGVSGVLNAVATRVVQADKLLGLRNASLTIDAVDVVRVVAAQAEITGHRAFLRTLRAAADWRGQSITILDRCEHIAVPVLIIWGDRDAIIPVSHAYHAARALAGAQVEVFTGAGHFPFRDDPDRFTALIEDFAYAH